MLRHLYRDNDRFWGALRRGHGWLDAGGRLLGGAHLGEVSGEQAKRGTSGDYHCALRGDGPAAGACRLTHTESVDKGSAKPPPRDG